ncbi:pyruvate dehydrogenase E2 component (dihydrolipoamide acetyltransferase) [Paramicrobacterium humi]|uniref:Dihydrolipoamide acetyltransferase component of pyruvate dehydrogenase complex n=1 Tax=Paramicrobacterium humi TaxID=640635 RepID=A0A1H4L886_9MICO|nr:dihydrolipoamide acetyltransferase family protein [Microbacterium humi]SEB66990.1 pyruvate dehydrogenase E2 component (dihydrolipoamide acetyltransferase) [Microbacterium humi]
MSTEVRVPTTGNAGEDVVVAQWSVAEGQSVSAGEVLLVLETAKSTVDIEAPVSGTLLRALAEEGDEVAEFSVVAILGEPGESVAGTAPDSDASPTASAPASSPVAASPAAAGPAPLASRRNARGKVKASPRAALMAERRRIDLERIVGSGPGGRIIVSDVIAAKAARPSTESVAPAAAAPAASALPDVDFEVVPVRGARKVTAQRMHESLQSTAQVTLTRYADASRLFDYAARLTHVSESTGRGRISINDLLLYATAKAVIRHPEANSAFNWDGIRRFRTVNLGFAVDTGQALLVPVIERAETLSLEDLASTAHDSIAQAKAGSLSSERMSGGTFTVSNLGGLGIHWFTPVLNPPQACILGIGAAHQAYPDAPRQLPLSLTFDHRALDGVAAAKVLAEIAQNIETVDVLSAFSA